MQTNSKLFLTTLACAILAACGGGGGGTTSPTTIGTTATSNAYNGLTLNNGVLSGGKGTYYGDINISLPSPNLIVSLSAQMVVPPLPTNKVGQLYIWPGVQSANGVLQPLLQWGWIASASNQPMTTAQQNFGAWSVQPSYQGIQVATIGGSVLSVNPGDTLNMLIAYANGTWTQTVNNMTTGQSTSYPLSFAVNVAFNVAFAIEVHNGNTGPSGPVQYSNVVIQLAGPQAGNWCIPNVNIFGPEDSMTLPVISADTTTCTIQNITLTPGPKMWGT